MVTKLLTSPSRPSARLLCPRTLLLPIHLQNFLSISFDDNDLILHFLELEFPRLFATFPAYPTLYVVHITLYPLFEPFQIPGWLGDTNCWGGLDPPP